MQSENAPWGAVRRDWHAGVACAGSDAGPGAVRDRPAARHPHPGEQWLEPSTATGVEPVDADPASPRRQQRPTGSGPSGGGSGTRRTVGGSQPARADRCPRRRQPAAGWSLDPAAAGERLAPGRCRPAGAGPPSGGAAGSATAPAHQQLDHRGRAHDGAAAARQPPAHGVCSPAVGGGGEISRCR